MGRKIASRSAVIKGINIPKKSDAESITKTEKKLIQ